MGSGFIHEKKGTFEYLLSPILNEAGVLHFITTRLGGCSVGHLSELNLGLGRGDSEEALEKNFQTVFGALGFTGENISITGQVHNTRSALITEPRYRSEGCDALITDRVGIPLMSYSADCVPVLLYDKRHNAAATVHSGWRGTAARITECVISDMKKSFGTQPKDVLAAIGPSIGPCCFEIQADAADILKAGIPELEFIYKKDELHFTADLWRAVAHTLIASGVPEASIDIAAECSVCNDKFFSCRRQKGKFGAMGAFIELRRCEGR